MCFSFVRDPLGARASSSFDEALSSVSHRLSILLRVEPTVSSLDTVTLPRLPSSEARPPSTFRLLFCKVLFFRNAGPTIVFPRCALAHSYRFLQSGPRYIGTSPPPPFSASDSALPPRHARLESVLRREFTKSSGYTLSRFYTAGQANFGDRTMSGIPVERSPRFIGPILETCRVVRRIFVELTYSYKKENIFSRSVYLPALRIL